MQGQMKNLMKQAQQMQAKLAKVQEELKSREVEASAGGGMVTAVVNGAQEVLSIKIDPDIVKQEEIEMLQDLMRAAVNEAIKKSRDMVSEEMGKITGGLGIPGLT